MCELGGMCVNREFLDVNEKEMPEMGQKWATSTESVQTDFEKNR